MTAARKFLSRFAADSSGATAVEYGLILTGIAVTIFVSLQAIGTSIVDMFAQVAALFQ
jgi:pilus assembly protein Flp/PilA